MEAFRIVVVLQALVCYEALQIQNTSKPPDSMEHGNESKLYITQTSRPCSWTVTSPDENQRLPAFKQPLHPLATQVCQTLGCGEVYELKESAADPNSSCLTGCIHHNSTLINCSRTAAGGCTVMSEVICDAPYITPTSSHCVWNFWSQAKSNITLTEEASQRLPDEICQSLGCGEVFAQTTSRAPPNSTCLTDCIYHNSHLRSCSTVVGSDCSVLSQVVCGNNMVRLSGGSHRCAGRVELWRAGQWGTVCDDEWDTQDADVVCAQLGCGYAISVTGQGDPYSQGRGPIQLDDLNCTGKERSLWECPAVMDDHDCGHKEDAGVVCSEYKALRLTGGQDRCSGRVEIHRNGLWGTVCDDSWDKQEAFLACTMLDCGVAKTFTGFEKPFTHKNETRWYYMCPKNAAVLWDCTEIDTSTKPHFCTDSKAAGVICNNSAGLPVPSSPKATTPALTTVQMTTAGPTVSWSLELLGCIGLSSALLIALILNIVLCCRAKKRKAHTVQQRFASLQTTAEPVENNYRDSVHLVKVTSNDYAPNAQAMPPQMWTQSSVESGSYDTDYELDSTSPCTAFPLSTFRNSMRYSAEGKAPGQKGINLQSVTEEDSGYLGNAAMQGYQPYMPNGTFQGVTTAPSEDSFETSSTSSGECYENIGLSVEDENYENAGENRSDLQTEILTNPVSTTHNTENVLNQTDNFLQDQTNVFMINHDQGFSKEPSCGEDSPIYSPVSVDTDFYSHVKAKKDPYSSESEYDDVDYLQRPQQ